MASDDNGKSENIEFKKHGFAIPVAVVLSLITSIGSIASNFISGSAANSVKQAEINVKMEQMRTDIADLKHDFHDFVEKQNKDRENMQNDISILNTIIKYKKDKDTDR